MLCLPSQWTWNEVKSWFLRLSNNQIGSYWHLVKLGENSHFLRHPAKFSDAVMSTSTAMLFSAFWTLFHLDPISNYRKRTLHCCSKIWGFYFDFTPPYDIMPVFIRVRHLSENLHIMSDQFCSLWLPILMLIVSESRRLVVGIACTSDITLEWKIF